MGKEETHEVTWEDVSDAQDDFFNEAKPVEEDADEPVEEAAGNEEVDEDTAEEEEVSQEGEGDGEDNEEDGEDLDPKDPESNAERSKLGRKLSGLEKTVQTLASTVEVLAQSLQQRNVAPLHDEDADDDEDFDFPETKAEFRKRVREEMERVKAQEQAQASDYNDKYIKSAIMSVQEAELDDDEAKAVWDIMRKPDYSKDHGLGAEGNAKMNFALAMKVFLKEQMEQGRPAKPEIPVNGRKPKAPLGAPPNAKTETPGKAKVVKLSPAAAAFARDRGISEDEVQAALGRPAKANLAQRG